MLLGVKAGIGGQGGGGFGVLNWRKSAVAPSEASTRGNVPELPYGIMCKAVKRTAASVFVPDLLFI